MLRYSQIIHKQKKQYCTDTGNGDAPFATSGARPRMSYISTWPDCVPTARARPSSRNRSAEISHNDALHTE